MKYRFSLLIVALSSRIVPRWRRAEWLREWTSELWHSGPKAPTPRGLQRKPDLLRRSLGSVQHAVWLRRRDWRYDVLTQDVRYALRSLRRTPGFTAIAISTLAIGIGANIGVFSLANALLLHPYPYPEPESLVRVRSLDLEAGNTAHMSLPDALDLARTSQLIAGLAAVDREPYNLGGGDEAVYVQGAQVTATLFDVLGTQPLRGRTFRPDEDLPGADNVVILGESLWRNSFAADDKIVGSAVTIDAEPYTVIGVMPSGGGYPDEANLWVTLRVDPGTQRRGSRWANVIARLAPGATIEQAQEEASTLAATLAEEFPGTNSGVGVRLVGLYESRAGDAQGPVALLLGAVGFVLLIVCANVANLLLARAAAREREIAVRAAMGASTVRLMRQLFTESALLSLAGAILGLGLGIWAVGALAAMIPVPLPEWVVFTVDWRVVTYALGMSVFATLVFGLVPAIRASRADLTESLKDLGCRRSIGEISRWSHMSPEERREIAAALPGRDPGPTRRRGGAGARRAARRRG